jgi:hypothetical protein
MRERVGAWLVKRGAGGRLSASESQLLESRRADVEATAAYYRGGAGRTCSTGSIGRVSRPG